MSQEPDSVNGTAQKKDTVPEMRILVDADALPNELKEILYRTAERTKIKVVMVANRQMRLPLSEYVSSVEVPNAGFNLADDKIIEIVLKGDLVITSDIPLADRAISAGAYALNPRGDLYTAANIKNIMSIRDMLEDMRASGEKTGGPQPFSKKHRENFMNHLNAITTKYLNSKNKK